MADIEPVGGPAGAAVETEPLEAAPGAIGAPAVSTPPAARPTGLVRWGVALITVAIMVGVVSVAVAILAAGGGASSVQGWLPKDTIAYLEVRADLPGDQRARMGDLLAKFPGFADQASNDAKIDEALDRLIAESGVSWSGDLKPWVGGEVGLAVTEAVLDLASLAQSGRTPAAMPDDGFVLLVAVKDGAAAKAWVAKSIGDTMGTETYAGGDLTTWLHNRAPLAFAVRKNVLILGPVTTVKAALDTAGSSPVATTASFAAARKTAPEAYLGFGYVDAKAIYDFALEALKQQGGTASACLPDPGAAVPGWLAGSARAEDGALVFTSTSPVAGTPPSAEGSASGAASHLPGTTVAAVEFRDLGPGLIAGLESLKTQLGCDPTTADAFTQIEQALTALGGADALVGWAGDAAVAVTVDGSTLGGGLAAVTTNEASATRTLDQVRTLLALAGAQAGVETREETYGEATLLVITIPSGGDVPEIAATVHGGVFAVGTIDFVKAVVDTKAGSSLADAAAYTRAVERAGGDGVADVFVSIAGLRAGIEAMLPADEKARYETEVKPFIEPFEAFVAVIEAPGTTAVARAVITFTK
jgi:hypothetical protein